MSAIVLEAVRQPQTEVPARPRADERPHLVLVPTGSEALRAARATQGPMRLTRFGRLTVTLVVATAIALLGVGLAGQLASASVDPRVVTVEPGQTLSGIAARELPALPIGDGVVRLQVANALSSSQVHAGQELVVPSP